VAEITPFKDFYVAEDYHKNYYESHREAPYCNFVIDPKMHKLIAKYGSDLKDKSKQLCYQVLGDPDISY